MQSEEEEGSDEGASSSGTLSSRFSVHDPQLLACSLDAVNKGKTLLRVLVAETLVPLVSGGPQHQQTVQRLAQAWLQATNEAVANGTVNMLLKQAVADTRTACAALETLLIPDVKPDIVSLDSVLNAKQGCLTMLKQALQATESYRKLERVLRSF